MAKKVYTRESLKQDVKNYIEGKLSKTKITVDWMDAYVAKLAPKTVDEYIKKCLSIPPVKRTIKGKETEYIDSKAIRAYFFETYFKDIDEKAKAYKKKSAEQAKKEKLRTATPEEKFIIKMVELKKGK